MDVLSDAIDDDDAYRIAARLSGVEYIPIEDSMEIIRALAGAGRLAPAPLRQEWSTADEGTDAHTCCGYEDRAVIEAHAARCGYQIVHRWVSDWIEAEADQ